MFHFFFHSDRTTEIYIQFTFGGNQLRFGVTVWPDNDEFFGANARHGHRCDRIMHRLEKVTSK